MISFQKLIDETDDIRKKNQLDYLKWSILESKSKKQLHINKDYDVPLTLIMENLDDSLQILDLGRSMVKDITPLKTLPLSLQRLILSNNYIMDITPLSTLPPFIEDLYLNNNQIVNIEALRNIPPAIRIVNLRNNAIVDYTPVVNLIAYLDDLQIYCDIDLDVLMPKERRMMIKQVLAFQSRQISRLSTNSKFRKLRQPEGVFGLGGILASMLG